MRQQHLLGSPELEVAWHVAAQGYIDQAWSRVGGGEDTGCEYQELGSLVCLGNQLPRPHLDTSGLTAHTVTCVCVCDNNHDNNPALCLLRKCFSSSVIVKSLFMIASILS